MFDKLINRVGVSLALVLMICELTYVNAKSLLFLTADTAVVDQAMSVVGSLAFSMVTVVVMRKAGTGWFKIVFPVFDTALVFLGFNLHYAELIMSGNDNPVRLYLSVFLAVFTGVITYSLGLINYRDHTSDLQLKTSDIENMEGEFKERVSELMCQRDEIESELKVSKSEIASLEGEKAVLQSDMSALRTEMEDRECDHKALKDHLANTQKELVKLRSAYLAAECSRIRKKKEANRTPEENEIIRMMSAN